MSRISRADRGRLTALQSVEQSGQSRLEHILRAEGLVENGPFVQRTRIELSQWSKSPNKRPRKVADERTVTETVGSVRLTIDGRLRLRELTNDWADYLEDHPYTVEVKSATDTEWHVFERTETLVEAVDVIRDGWRTTALVSERVTVDGGALDVAVEAEGF